MHNFHHVTPGMSMERVGKLLGAPDHTCPLTFGADRLTTWVYLGEGGPFYVWFNGSEKVRMKSLPSDSSKKNRVWPNRREENPRR